MADYPEYKQSVGIQPAAQAGGQQEAISGVAASYDSMANMASKMASNLAMDKAREKGLADAQTPGMRNVRTPITPVDYAYNQAYLDESGKVLSNQANMLLDDFAFEFSKIRNPTGSDMARVQEESIKGVDGFLKQADPKIRTQLKRNFEDKLHSNILDFSKAVEIANTKRKVDTFSANTEANVNNYSNYFNNYMPLAAKTAYDEQVKNTKSMESYVTPAKFKQLKNADKLIFESAKHQGLLKSELEDKGEVGAAEYIKDVASKSIPGINDSERDNIVSQLKKTFTEKKNTARLQDEITLQQAQKDILAGTMTQEKLLNYGFDLSEPAYNKVKIAMMKSNKKAIDTEDLVSFFGDNAENHAALDGTTKEQKNSAFEALAAKEAERLGHDLSPEEIADIAKRHDVAFPNFNKTLTDGINSNNADASAKFAQMYRSLRLHNKNTVSKVGNAAVSKAIDMNGSLIAGLTNQEALDSYKDNVAGMSEQTTEENKAMYKQELRDRGLLNPKNMLKHISSELDLNTQLVKDAGGAVDDWKTLHWYHYNRTGDYDDAAKYATDKFYETWATSETNGFRQLMKFAPNMMYPQEKVSVQMVESLNSIVNNNNEVSEKQSVPSRYTYKFDQEQIDEARMLIGPNPPIFTKRFERTIPILSRVDNLTGEVKSGRAIIKSDDITTMPENGKGMSYSWMWYEDGRTMGQQISVFEKVGKRYKAGKARFNVDEKRINDEIKYTKEEMRAYREEHKAEFKAKGLIKGEFSFNDPSKYFLLALARYLPKLALKVVE